MMMNPQFGMMNFGMPMGNMFNANMANNLDDENEESPENIPIDKVDCSGNNPKCVLENMVCENDTMKINCTCKEGYYPNFNNETDKNYCEIWCWTFL